MTCMRTPAARPLGLLRLLRSQRPPAMEAHRRPRLQSPLVSQCPDNCDVCKNISGKCTLCQDGFAVKASRGPAVQNSAAVN